jgi:hypothetical protein
MTAAQCHLIRLDPRQVLNANDGKEQLLPIPIPLRQFCPPMGMEHLISCKSTCRTVHRKEPPLSMQHGAWSCGLTQRYTLDCVARRSCKPHTRTR